MVRERGVGGEKKKKRQRRGNQNRGVRLERGEEKYANGTTLSVDVRWACAGMVNFPHVKMLQENSTNSIVGTVCKFHP